MIKAEKEVLCYCSDNMLYRKVTLFQVQMLYSPLFTCADIWHCFLSEMRGITRAYTFSQLMLRVSTSLFLVGPKNRYDAVVRKTDSKNQKKFIQGGSQHPGQASIKGLQSVFRTRSPLLLYFALPAPSRAMGRAMADDKVCSMQPIATPIATPSPTRRGCAS